MSEDILKDSWLPDEAVSKRIKDRIKKAGKRFHSNDNISEFIEDGEMDLLQAEVQEKLLGVLDSLLIDTLLDIGFTNLSVLDISVKALERAQKRLGKRAKEVEWIESNILDFKPQKSYTLWHDRASFHFLTEEEDIKKYTTLVDLAKSESLVLGTFSTSGPHKCSGLVIRQYDCKSLATCFKRYFSQLECLETDHITPFDTIQKFVFSRFKRKP